MAGSTWRSTSTVLRSGASRRSCLPVAGCPRGVFEIGIGLCEDARGNGYGREALALFTDWLFDHAEAERVQAPTDPANVAMRAVFERIGWRLVETLRQLDRDWMMYALTRAEWRARRA